MKTDDLYKNMTAENILKRIVELRIIGRETSGGERVSMAAIGRTLDPPVNRSSVLRIVYGERKSKRIREAIERELGVIYWIPEKYRGQKAAPTSAKRHRKVAA